MDIIKDFFTEGPNSIEFFYLVLVLSFIGFVLFKRLPERIALKFFVPYRMVTYRTTGDRPMNKDYDWTKALNRQSILLLIICIFSMFVLFLSNVYGIIVAKVALGILALLAMIGGYWIDPARK